MMERSTDCEKTPRSPFNKPVLSEIEAYPECNRRGLRANEVNIEAIGNVPFVLSLVKHENGFFSSLSESTNRGWARRGLTPTWLLTLFLLVVACSSEPEKYKALVKISNVKVARTDERTLAVTLDYDLEPGVKLPLPYKEVLVFPLEPHVKLAGTLAPFDLSVGTVAVSLEIPADAEFDWQDLSDKDTCCIVSLKGLREELGTKTPQYERISNEVRILPPQLSG